MSTILNDLEARINGLTDDQLINLVHVDFADYRPEAIEFANCEIRRRGLVLDQRSRDEASSEGVQTTETSPSMLQQMKELSKGTRAAFAGIVQSHYDVAPDSDRPSATLDNLPEPPTCGIPDSEKLRKVESQKQFASGCPSCHKPADAESAFCKHCGLRLMQSEALPASPNPTPRSNNLSKPILIAVVVVVSAIALGALILFIAQFQNSSNSRSVSILPSLDDGRLTQAKAQNALNRWVSSGNVSVLGVQEVSAENAAIAQLSFSNLGYTAHDPIFGGDHPQTYSGAGTAIFTHYNDGRWVLTRITIGQGFNARWWENINVEAR
jgi:hypothetical protein